MYFYLVLTLFYFEVWLSVSALGEVGFKIPRDTKRWEWKRGCAVTLAAHTLKGVLVLYGLRLAAHGKDVQKSSIISLGHLAKLQVPGLLNQKAF